MIYKKYFHKQVETDFSREDNKQDKKTDSLNKNQLCLPLSTPKRNSSRPNKKPASGHLTRQPRDAAPLSFRAASDSFISLPFPVDPKAHPFLITEAIMVRLFFLVLLSPLLTLSLRHPSARVTISPTPSSPQTAGTSRYKSTPSVPCIYRL